MLGDLNSYLESKAIKAGVRTVTIFWLFKLIFWFFGWNPKSWSVFPKTELALYIFIVKAEKSLFQVEKMFHFLNVNQQVVIHSVGLQAWTATTHTAYALEQSLHLDMQMWPLPAALSVFYLP